ncbi:hypothetical protein [uncultured Alistipes sp.]|uniref:hypothetical protein n=1 Tax=uncultured Alistipes sp. TaxID=538949 RepID=UPI002586570D|nr:hypothetical protein [uncultured Alistipes sp.]
MKKIMFNDRYGLTQAVIEGRKTMTRRIVPTKTRLRRALAVIHDEPHGSEQEEYLKSAYYKVGEIVAVAQRYQDIFDYSNCVNPYDWEDDDKPSGWTNKMFTKAKLMPHRIRITGIKCERLQDISEADCLKEGIRQAYAESILGMYGYIDHNKGTGLWFNTPREAFASLIDKVSGCGTWASNPWVVAYEFELVK